MAQTTGEENYTMRNKYFGLYHGRQVNVKLENAVGDEKFKEGCWKTSQEETSAEIKENITMERSEFRVPAGPRIFFSPRRPDRFWGPHSLLSNGYRG
jgi:hypothetical protein